MACVQSLSQILTSSLTMMTHVLLLTTIFAPILSAKDTTYTINATRYDLTSTYKQTIFVATIDINRKEYKAAISLTNFMIHAWPKNESTNIPSDFDEEAGPQTNADLLDEEEAGPKMNAVLLDEEETHCNNDLQGSIDSHDTHTLSTDMDAYHPTFEPESLERSVEAGTSHHSGEHFDLSNDWYLNSILHDPLFKSNNLPQDFRTYRILSPKQLQGNKSQSSVSVRNVHHIRSSSGKRAKRPQAKKPMTKQKRSDVFPCLYRNFCSTKDRELAKIAVGDLTSYMMYCKAGKMSARISLHDMLKTINCNAILGIGFANKSGNYFVNTLFERGRSDEYVSLNLQDKSLLVEIRNFSSAEKLYDVRAHVDFTSGVNNLRVDFKTTSLTTKVVFFVLDLSTPFIWLGNQDFGNFIQAFDKSIVDKWKAQSTISLRKLLPAFPCNEVNITILPDIIFHFEKYVISLEPSLYIRRTSGSGELCILHVGSSKNLRSIEVGNILLEKYKLTMKYSGDLRSKGERGMHFHFEEKNGWTTSEDAES